MSFVVLWRDSNSTSAKVLDTTDLSVETISRDDVKLAKYAGLDISNYSKTHSIFGLSVNGNIFEIMIHGYDEVIYKGAFPPSCNRGELYDLDIKLVDFGLVGNDLCLLLTCDCWCRFDIEIPLVMIQVVKLPLSDIKNGSIAIYTSEPINFATKDIAKSQYVQCHGDYPRGTSMEQSMLQEHLLDGELRILGVEFGSTVPSNFDICRSLKFFKLQD